MKKSNNPQVQKFLEDIKVVDEEKYEILQELRKLVFGVSKKIDERMMYGGIMFTSNQDFGGIFVSKHHVSFEFSDGYCLKDSGKNLEGTGKKRRHLKIKSNADITNKKTKYYVQQAMKLYV